VNDFFGNSVAIWGSMVAIGSEFDANNGTICGSAYVFEQVDSNWVEQTKLLASDGHDTDRFGCSVSISGSYCIVGAFGTNNSTGSAYVFGPPATYLAADLNNDCAVNMHDLAIITNNWLTTDSSFGSYCLAQWKMNDNDANTTVIDSSGNGNDGTAQQSTSLLHTTGKINGALTFNGTSDYVDIGPVVGTGAYTKVAWIRIDTDSGYNNIVSSSTTSHAFWVPASYSYTLRAGHSGYWHYVIDSETMEADVWNHVAVTFDPDGDPNVGFGKMILYKNGVQVDEAINVEIQTSSTTDYIGRFLSSYYFKGAIDNVMIFDGALTIEEIAALYNGGSGTEIIALPIQGDIYNDGFIDFLDFAEFAVEW
jgi:hypothetical protein